MHGTVKIFLAVVPFLTGAFGNYLVPLQIGASDMAFPRVNALSYWIYLASGLLMLASFFVTGKGHRTNSQPHPWGRSFLGICSQLCGLGHYRMRGDYAVLTDDEWQRWLAGEVALTARTAVRP